MKRRLFLRSLWLKGIALPAAYFLSPALKSAAADAADDPAADNKTQRHGCGRTEQGEVKPNYGVVARDFYDPYLELIRLLKEASEIEHSLMIQYLFAAFSLKPKYQALVGLPEPSSDGLLGIAIQEMQHLATVNQLLVALGSGPNLDRQDFPREPDIYPFPLSLERLTRSSLARYTYVEAGRDSIPVDGPMSASDQLLCDELTAELGTNTELNHVAGLYGIIVNHLESMADEGTLQLDAADEWLGKLNEIMIEGEQKHFRFFSELLMGNHLAFDGKRNPWTLDEDHPDYPSFYVPPNPTAYLGHENQIRSAEARALAWLSNLHYWMVLMMLDLHYRIDSEALNAMAQTHMLGPLRSVAGRLAEYGSGLPFDRLSLGYSPAPEPAGNLRFIGRLSREADTLAHKIGPDLPPGYPLELHQATSALLNMELDAVR
jgi:rubrerythrin